MDKKQVSTELEIMIKSEGWKTFTKVINERFINRLGKDLQEKEYKTIEVRNRDMDKYNYLKELIKLPEMIIKESKPVKMAEKENIDIYE